MSKITLFWFRRDLRLEDNRGLFQALKSGFPVLPVFLFDDEISEQNESRVNFVFRALKELKSELEKAGSSLLVLEGNPAEIWPALFRQYEVAAIFTNRIAEPHEQQKEIATAEICRENFVEFRNFQDRQVFGADELLKNDGKPYTVFTPYYKNRWRPMLSESVYEKARSAELKSFFLKTAPFPETKTGAAVPEKLWNAKNLESGRLLKYPEKRDFPAVEGTSLLGVHLAFGTIGIRQAVREALNCGAENWLRQLAWRDFFSMILSHFPHTMTQSFKPAYDRIPWLNQEEGFIAWQEGRTGFPMVDAGMRELRQTGFMHNRLRMLTASFLCKHLLTDWRWGEAYFASQLIDYEQASNIGGWQWAAGCGCDAAPYFRIFNPSLQQKKFDPEEKYIRKFVTDRNTSAYPAPIVDHAGARDRALKTYKTALNQAS